MSEVIGIMGREESFMLMLAPHRNYKAGLEPRIERMIEASHATISAAMAQYKLKGVFALFSGGHDSLVSTYITSLHPAFRGVIHIDTGTGLRATEAFVVEVCKRFGWSLITKAPFVTFDMLATEHGFPGPPQHKLMYGYLKARPLAQAKIEARKLAGCVKKRDTIGFATGVRKLESDIRMGSVQALHKDKAGVWIAPIADYHKLDCEAIMAHYGLPRNPVKDSIGISGECECGSFASAEELRLIDLHYPLEAERIRRREKLVKAAQEFHAWEYENKLRDKPAPQQKLCQWGHGRGISDAQIELFPMCFYCKDGLNQAGEIGVDPDRELLAVKAAKVG